MFVTAVSPSPFWLIYSLPLSLRERKYIPVKLWGALSITGSLLFNRSLPLTPLSCLLVQIGSSAVIQAPVPWAHQGAFSSPPEWGDWIRLSRVNSALETSCERCPCDPGLHNGPVEAPWSQLMLGIPSPPSLSCILSGCNMWWKKALDSASDLPGFTSQPCLLPFHPGSATP